MFMSLRLSPSLSKEEEVTVDGWGHLASLSVTEPPGTGTAFLGVAGTFPGLRLCTI